jgi:hypothetical protein
MRLAVPVALLASLAGLAGCISPPDYSSDPAAQAPAQQAPAPPAQAPGPAGPVTGYTGDLRKLLLPRPANATNAADPKSDGTISLDQAAAAFGDPTQGRTQLVTLGYQRGAIGEWSEPDGTHLSDIVFLFGDHPSATTFTYGAQSSYTMNQLFDPPIPIPGIPLGNVYQLTAAGPDKQFLTEVFFTKNSMSVELSIIGPTKVTSARALSLAQTQYGLLP